MVGSKLGHRLVVSMLIFYSAIMTSHNYTTHTNTPTKNSEVIYSAILTTCIPGIW